MSDDTKTQDKPQEKAKDERPKFVFVGDPRDNWSGPPMITMKGKKFLRNRVTPVEERHAEFFQKHSHFMTPDEADEHMATQSEDGEEEDFAIGEKDLEEMSVAEIKAFLKKHNVPYKNDATKPTLIALAVDEVLDKE